MGATPVWAAGEQLPGHVPTTLMVLGLGVACMSPFGPLSIVPLEWTDPPFTVTFPLPRLLTPEPRMHRPHDLAEPGTRAARARASMGICVTPASTPKPVVTLRVGTTTLSLVG